jgi:hypothetical protein
MKRVDVDALTREVQARQTERRAVRRLAFRMCREGFKVLLARRGPGSADEWRLRRARDLALETVKRRF